jgi:succinoglycan biosynthesis protein ExoA
MSSETKSTIKNISFIIPVRPGDYPERTIACIRKVNYPAEAVEIIITEGKEPSKQRNLAVSKASGEYLYFLDDDSFIEPNNISIGLNHFGDNKIGAVGGPALTLANAKFLEEVFGETFGSFFGTYKTRLRSRQIGGPRLVRGEELILCNMIMPKEVFLNMGGLNSALYPNEENELIKRMRNDGYRFYYVPEMKVHRAKRNTIQAFMKQMYSYGEGRSKHIFEHFNIRDLVFFVPSFFLIYLFALIFYHPPLALLPLLLYFALASAASFKIVMRKKKLSLFMALIPSFFLMHTSYGLGLLNGMLGIQRSRKSHKEPIRLMKLALDNEIPQESIKVAGL